jgi:dihydroorotase
MTSFILPQWYDLHVHLRQDPGIDAYIQAQIDMGCCGVLAMPNTKPPVGKIKDSDDLPYWSLEHYLNLIRDNGGDAFLDVIVPLYLTKDTTPAMIEDGAKSGLLRAVKYYPPHGTTNSDHGRPIGNFMENGVFSAMEDNNIVLCIHGEEHALEGPEYFDAQTNAERTFYEKYMPEVVERFPDLRIVAEHITTKEAVAFTKNNGLQVAATITPQHLLYTVGHLVQGLKYHLYCMPLVKFDADRQALREAAIDPNNTKFFAGTDSAPHTVKATPCGCAAGCFTGGIAPQLYAQSFEEAGCDLSTPDNQKTFKKFLCDIGPQFYDLPLPSKTFKLIKTPSVAKALTTSDGEILPLPLGLGAPEMPWSIDIS